MVQLSMLSPNLPKTKIPYAQWGGGKGRSGFQLFMLIPNLPKTQIPYVRGNKRGGGVVDFWVAMLDL